MNQIVIIVFYFGQFPWYYDFFINSCLNNPNVDFLFFSDNFKKKEQTKNLTKFPFSLENFNTLSSNKLKMKIDVKGGYKICDFRPAFGVVFEDYIIGYEFWGYSDIDLIFGRITEFINNEILQNFDFVSVKAEYPSGYFAIVKNNIEMNEIFRQSKDYEYIFQEDKNMLFEECGGYYNEVVNLGLNILDTNCKYETFHHVLEKNSDKIRLFFDFLSIEGIPGNIKYQNGILSYKNEFEVILYHLSHFKSNVFCRDINWKKIPQEYFISKYSFYKRRFCKIYFNLKNYVKVKLFNQYFFVNKFISQLINKKFYLKEGKFKYMNQEIMIVKIKNSYCLKIGEDSYEIIFSAFNDFFFAKGKKITYKVLHDGNGFFIDQILFDGNTIRYS